MRKKNPARDAPAKPLSDDELEARLKELLAEKAARDAAKHASELRAHLARMIKLQTSFTPDVIDALEPEHRAGRYGGVCMDDMPMGSYRTAEDDKEYNCNRCRLINFVAFDEEALLNTSVELRIRWTA